MDTYIEEIDVTPSTNILDVLGNSGYSLESAIADIIDNSITAKSKNIRINFDFGQNPKVMIIDDGCGMSIEKLKEAAIPAKKSQKAAREENDLGRYSLGLKSASKSFCGKLIIASKAKSQKPNCVIVDFDEISKTKKWIAYVVDNDEYFHFIKDSGTVVAWEKLNFLPSLKNKELLNDEINEKVSNVEMHISHVFSEFILNKSIKFYINDNLIEAWDPFARKFDNTKITYDEEKIYKNKTLKFKTYILPLIDSLSDKDKLIVSGYGLQKQQGFYIYRNNRLISEGGWLNLKNLQCDNKSNYCRIRVDIPSSLDEEFQTNFIKNSISIPLDLQKFFKEIAKNAKNESLHNYNYTKHPTVKKTKIKGKEIPVWFVDATKKGICLKINKSHPLVESIKKEVGDRQFDKIINLLTKTIPVVKIQNANGGQPIIDKSYLKDMMTETYNHLKDSGMTKIEIEKEMANTEPFCNEFSTLLEFLEKIEVNE